jgi:hypothetical protein
MTFLIEDYAERAHPAFVGMHIEHSTLFFTSCTDAFGPGDNLVGVPDNVVPLPSEYYHCVDGSPEDAFFFGLDGAIEEWCLDHAPDARLTAMTLRQRTLQDNYFLSHDRVVLAFDSPGGAIMFRLEFPAGNANGDLPPAPIYTKRKRGVFNRTHEYHALVQKLETALAHGWINTSAYLRASGMLRQAANRNKLISERQFGLIKSTLTAAMISHIKVKD